MICDVITYDATSNPPWARIFRVADGKWYDPESAQWLDAPSSSRKLAYRRMAPSVYPHGWFLLVPTPAAIFGINEDVFVFTHYNDPDNQAKPFWDDWFYATVNPTSRVAGGHNVWDGKQWTWHDFHPSIQ